jgi:hypothetical protein
MPTTDPNFPIIDLSDAGTDRHAKHGTRRIRRNGRRILDLTQDDSPYTLTDWEADFVGAALTSSDLTINLPAPTSNNQGWEIVVKARTLGGQSITIDAGGGEFIDGAQTAVLSSDYAKVSIVQWGTRWLKVEG